MNALAKNIRRKLTENNMTQKELADKANISQVMVYKLVSGKVTATAKIMSIAEALNCHPNELVKEYNLAESLKSSEFALAQNNIVKVLMMPPYTGIKMANTIYWHKNGEKSLLTKYKLTQNITKLCQFIDSTFEGIT